MQVAAKRRTSRRVAIALEMLKNGIADKCQKMQTTKALNKSMQLVSKCIEKSAKEKEKPRTVINDLQQTETKYSRLQI